MPFTMRSLALRAGLVLAIGSTGGCAALAPVTRLVEPVAQTIPDHITEHATDAREVWHFDRLKDLAANSVIVEGRVTSIEKDRVSGSGEHSITINRVTIRVLENLRGDVPSTVIMEEDGVLAARSNLGDHGIYFLVRKRDQDERVFRLITSQGRYRVDSTGTVHPSNPEDQLAISLSEFSLGELRREIAMAIREAEQAGITPRPLVVADPEA